MPMIDVYAVAGTFPDKHQLAGELATKLMAIEQVAKIPMCRENIAAFVHTTCHLTDSPTPTATITMSGCC